MADIKRPNYFTTQFLKQEDFNDEQSYHRDQLKRHNQRLHVPGVAHGLEVRKTGAKQITVSPGLAIDSTGQEIQLNDSQVIDLSGSAPNTNVPITIWYAETQDPADKYGETNFYTRMTIRPKISPRDGTAPTTGEGPAVILAQVPLDDAGQVVDERNFILTERRSTSAALAPKSVGLGQINLVLVKQGTATVSPGPAQVVFEVKKGATNTDTTIYWPAVKLRNTTGASAGAAANVQATIVFTQVANSTAVDVGITFSNQALRWDPQTTAPTAATATVDWFVYTIGS